jgi:hypothetical protein
VPEPHWVSVHVDQVKSICQAQRAEAHIGNRTRVDHPVEGNLPTDTARYAGPALVEASCRGVIDAARRMRPQQAHIGALATRAGGSD